MANKRRIPERVVPAIWACVGLAPIFAGVMWFADILSRTAIMMVVVSHDQPIPEALRHSALGDLWPAAVAIYAITCLITLGLAWSGLLPGAQMPIIPPPPPTFEEWREAQKKRDEANKRRVT